MNTNANTTSQDTLADGVNVVEILRPRWGWIFLSGLLTLIFGLLAFWMPVGAVYAMTLLFGAYAMADGILSVISAVRNRDNFWQLMIRGALGIMVGIIVLVLPGLSVISLVAFNWAMISIWAIATGIMEILAAIRLRKEIEGEWLLALSGIVSLVLGLAIPVVLWNNPAAGIVTMGWLIGFYAVLHGVLEMALALSLRKLSASA
ncbi:MAG TPA: HdeD family acid-resistance protein [Aliiroseovarius sp.]|nr:HdeD family acid-resistance protein [Aliiroseovarius sp.]